MIEKGKDSEMIIKKTVWMMLLILLCPLALLAEGFANENLGGIKPGDDWGKVNSKLGQPDSQTDDGFIEELECYNWTYKYDAKGLEVSVCHANKDRTGTAFVTFIRTLKNSQAKTGKGIGLGATRGEIQKAYGKSEGDDGGQIFYYDFESGVQIGFKLVEGKVSEISLTATS
jgi:hypothetical protein